MTLTFLQCRASLPSPVLCVGNVECLGKHTIGDVAELVRLFLTVNERKFELSKTAWK